MFILLSCNNLFLREISKKKLERLAKLAHHDPTPLVEATQVGYFKAIKKDAIKLLKYEKNKAKYLNTKEQFQSVIDMLE